MSKRPLHLIGLGFILCGHGTLLEAFIVPSPSTNLPRIRESCANQVATRNVRPSTWLLKTRAGAGDDEIEDSARSNPRWDVNHEESVEVTASRPLDSTSDVRDLSLDRLLRELDERDIRYSPFATRSDLEQLLHSAREDSTQRMTLKALLGELDRLEIRYAPTASRQELEVLLESHTLESDDTSRAEKKAQPSVKGRMKLAQILEELDKQDIRYPPTASRAQLENLLQHSSASETARPSGTPQSTATSSPGTTRRSLQSMIKELDRRKIRYPPTATRADLEALLSKSRTTRESATCSRRLPLETLLVELDRRNIRYSPTATRVELEELLRRKSKQQISSEAQRRRRRRQRQSLEPRHPIESILRTSTQVASKTARTIPSQVSNIVSSSDVTSRLSKVAEKAARQARRVRRRASDFLNEDEDGIREPDWYYVSVDNTIDVPAVRVDEGERRPGTANKGRSPGTSSAGAPRRPPPRRRKPRSSSVEDGQSDERIPRHRGRKQSTSPTSNRSSIAEKPGRQLLQLPPTSQDTVPLPESEHAWPSSSTETSHTNESPVKEDLSNQKRRSRGTPTKKRPIYSPYADQKEGGDNEDVFDRLGNLVADTADRLLWGPDDDNDTAPVKPPPTKQEQRRKQSDSHNKHPKPRYWKDRLAEQVDYALGIHEDGEYYNSWEKQLEREGNGSEFGLQPRTNRKCDQSRNRRVPAKRRKQSNGPFWEENGTIMALLLGRSSSGRKIGIERYTEERGETPMLTTFFNSAFRATLLVASYICRWASVRGAVPQPIVVMGAASAFLCARPKQRLWTVALTLVAMRTIGELVHAYVYGDEDWEEEDWEDENNRKPSSATGSSNVNERTGASSADKPGT